MKDFEFRILIFFPPVLEFKFSTSMPWMCQITRFWIFLSRNSLGNQTAVGVLKKWLEENLGIKDCHAEEKASRSILWRWMEHEANLVEMVSFTSENFRDFKFQGHHFLLLQFKTALSLLGLKMEEPGRLQHSSNLTICKLPHRRFVHEQSTSKYWLKP